MKIGVQLYTLRNYAKDESGLESRGYVYRK